MPLLILSRRYTPRQPHPCGGTSERAVLHLLVQGDPAVRLRAELVRYDRDGHCAGLEVYLSSEHTPIPWFVGYAEQLGETLWEKLFRDARGWATGGW